MPAWPGPISLAPNRIGRFYRGGALLEAFRRLPSPADANEPEDWIGSVTSVWQPSGSTDAGLSCLADGRSLRSLVGNTGVLVKLLDAAERLPIHCHPSRSFASRMLGSSYGKAEAWIVLATRQIPGAEAPNIRLGWRDAVSHDELVRWVEGQETGTMLDAMPVRPVTAGDVWFVPPGVPHAIGAGVFMVEVQEPTDFSIVAEWRGFPVSESDASLGRGWDVMLDAFDRSPMTDARLESLRQRPRVVRGSRPITETVLVDQPPFFSASRLVVRDATDWPFTDSFAVAVVTAGNGRVDGSTSGLPVQRGDTFAMPAGVLARLVGEPELELIVCRGHGTRDQMSPAP
jgi:mannose-6-phosphate isomerase